MGSIGVADGDIAQSPHARRRARRLAFAALAALVIGLVGCSAGGGAVNEGGALPGVAGEDAGGGDAAAEDDRSVIIEGSMSIVATDVQAASAAAAGIVLDAGGRIEGREEWTDHDGAAALVTTTLVLRIPADTLDTVLDALRDLGTVESLRTTTADVTSDVQDVDARVDALQSTITRLASFQAEATSVDDLLSIEQEISERQAELEGYLTRQAALAEQVAFSTITLSIQSEPSAPNTPDSFWGGLVVGWTSLVTFVAGFTVVLGMLLPSLFALGLLAVVIALLVRWLRRRRPAEPPAPPADEASPWVARDEPQSSVGAGSAPPAP